MFKKRKKGYLILDDNGNSFRISKFFIEFVLVGLCLMVVALIGLVNFYFTERNNSFLLKGDNLILENENKILKADNSSLLEALEEKEKEFELLVSEIDDLKGRFTNVVGAFSDIKNSDIGGK